MVSSQEAGWDASERDGMSNHGNKLSHWQDCTIAVVRAGCRQQMQPLSCEGCVASLVAGVKEAPPWLDKEMQGPWIWVDGDEEGEGSEGWLWRLYFVVIYAALFEELFSLFVWFFFLVQGTFFFFFLTFFLSLLHIFCLISQLWSFFVCICDIWNNNLTFLWLIRISVLSLSTTASAVSLCGSNLHPFCCHTDIQTSYMTIRSQRKRTLIRHGFVWALRPEAPCCWYHGSDTVPTVQYFSLYIYTGKNK